MNDYHKNPINKISGVIVWQQQAHRIKIVKSRLYFDVIAACLHQAAATEDEADACADIAETMALRKAARQLRKWANQPDSTITNEPRYQHLRARQIWPHRVTETNLALYLSLLITASEPATANGTNFLIDADLATVTVWATQECKEIAWFVGHDMMGFVVQDEKLEALIAERVQRLPG